MNDKPKTALSEAIELAGMVVDRRGITVPILANVCLTVTDAGRLVVQASDLDTHVAIDVGTGGEPFETTASFETLRRIAARGEEVIVRPGEGMSLDILAPGDIRYSLPTLPASDFPRMNEWEPTASFRLSAAQLLDDLQAGAAGISTEETRYYLNGVFMHIIGDQLALAATDGHRLFQVRRQLPKRLTDLLGRGGVIIPRKAVRALMAALERSCDDDVQIDVAELKARFTLAGVTVTTKTIDGTYPDYQRAIPKAPPAGLTCRADELRSAAEAARVIASMKMEMVVLRPADKTVTAESKTDGTMVAPLACETSGEPPKGIGFSARYLIDALASFGSSVVTLGMGAAADPLLITSEAVPQLTVVLMPMRVS